MIIKRNIKFSLKKQKNAVLPKNGVIDRRL